MKIVVLAGGLSPERDVSLSSGALIASALSRCGHAVKIVDVYEGTDELPEDIDSVFECGKSYSSPVSEHEPDLDEVRRRNGGREARQMLFFSDFTARSAKTASFRQRLTVPGSGTTPAPDIPEHCFQWIKI